MSDLTLPLAFFAGIVSFLSPCILPLLPAFMTFIAGTSIPKTGELTPHDRTKIFISTVFFVLGFAVVFSILGILLQSVLAPVAYDVRIYLGYAGGTILIFFGLMMMGLIRVAALEREYKLSVHQTKYTFLTAFLFGAAFAVGWTPCVGAVLGAVLTLAITDPAGALGPMLAYSLGLGLPFLVMGAFISRAQGVIRWLGPYLNPLRTVFGVILVILGILVFTDSLAIAANLFTEPFLAALKTMGVN